MVKSWLDTTGPTRAANRRSGIRPLVLAGCWLLGLVGQAWGDIGIVASGGGRFYQAVALTLAADLRERFPDRPISMTDLTAGEDAIGGETLLITIGGDACGAAMEAAPSRSLLCLAVTSDTWHGLADEDAGNKAAIFIDQPVGRYLYLAREMIIGADRYGTLLGSISSAHLAELNDAASRLGVGLRAEIVSLGDNPLRVLNPLFSQIQVFIAIPDQAAFNRSVARWALYLGFRHKVPLIGFSRSYVDAGAAASLYTSPEDITRQAAAWLEVYFAGTDQEIWRAAWPRYFTVTVNQSVARSLRLPKTDEAELHRRVSDWIEREGLE